jgi:hypothetical protein
MQGAILATVESRAEEVEIAMLTGSTSAYFAASDQIQEGTWRWPDGRPVVYTHWNQGEPNDANRREDCAELLGGTGGLWNDVPCDAGRAFVCERPASPGAAAQ